MTTWDDRTRHGDWLLQKWAEWSCAKRMDVRGFPSVQPFAIKSGGTEPIADRFALSIEAAVIASSPATRGILREAYIHKNWNTGSDEIIIECITEFLHVYEAHNPVRE